MQTAPTIHTTPSRPAGGIRRHAHAGWRAALAAALLWTAGATAAELPPLSHSLTPAAANTPAPPLRLKDIEGRFHDIAALKGKVVLVNFWATWCPPCRREMPSMDRLARKLAGEDFVVLAVDVGEDADTVETFLSQLDGGHAFPILLDTRGHTLRAWGGGGLPTTYLVDRQGRIAYTAVGGREFDHPEIERTVRELLARK
jgi:thiol-disulfide isomerase/thioredoxin